MSRAEPNFILEVTGAWEVDMRYSTVADIDLPGFRLHQLKGELKGFWAVTVRANWRVIFRFADGNVLDVDCVDYH